MSMLRGAEVVASMAMQSDGSSGGSSGVIWGLIAASFVLEAIVFAVCVALVRIRKKKQ